VVSLILVDTNLLIYASFRVLPQHRAAREWLDGQLTGPTRLGVPWQSLLGFLRVATNPRAFSKPASMEDAWDQVITWLACDVVWVPQPTERHPELLGRFLALPGVRANLEHDAHLAALAIEHGLIMCSTDGDFARFPGLRWQNPLAA
jgi:toxin-antitoxin system PIN domain toxin